MLRNRIIVQVEVVVERVLRNRKRQEEIVTEARDEVGGRGAGGRVLRGEQEVEC